MGSSRHYMAQFSNSLLTLSWHLVAVAVRPCSVPATIVRPGTIPRFDLIHKTKTPGVDVARRCTQVEYAWFRTGTSISVALIIPRVRVVPHTGDYQGDRNVTEDQYDEGHRRDSEDQNNEGSLAVMRDILRHW